jgi:hypothetical protein
MTADQRAARERKQKIFVAVGGLLLLALLAIQLPKLMGGSDSSAAASTTTTTETSAVTGEPVPPADSAVPVSVALVDTDRPMAPGPGQLRTFGTFTRKDPFVQQLVPPDEAAGATEGSAPSGASGSGGGDQPAQTPSKGFTVGGGSGAAVTVVAVNGTRQTLAPGTAFPAADPVFVLVTEQPGAKSVVIGVAGGAYANGAHTTKLKVGKPLVLVNTATGARYRLVLVAVGNRSASSPAAAPGAVPDGTATAP